MKNNLQLAEMFERIADILEFQGELVFKVNSYRKAARILKDLNRDVADIYREGELEKIPGIGSGLAKKIAEFLDTGRMSKYEEIVQQVPESLIRLMQIQNLGPKTLALLHKQFGVQDLNDLKQVLHSEVVRQVPGMGEKKRQNILKGIELYEQSQERIAIGVALPLVQEILDILRKHPEVLEIAHAGSLRRMKETVGDLDILAASKRGSAVIEAFTTLPLVRDVLARGETKASIIVEGGRQVDLRVVAPESFGAALQYFTGSKEHNIRLRELARKQNMKINEYGLFSGDQRIAGETEESIYAALGMDWIPPEMREDRGEIELALQHRLPQLIEHQHILGDLHVHSTYSDGKASIPELAERARQLGYRYLAICDHSQSVGYAGGLTPERLQEKMEEIKELNQSLTEIRLLCGAEVDILADGTLDYPDEVLQELDIVIAAIHTGFKQDVTRRMIKAMENPFVNIIAHPTGRLISRREGYEIEIEEVIKMAATTGTALELNAYYDRLDLNEENLRRAAEAGVKIAINTDSHLPSHLDMMIYGVGIARRAWLQPEQVLNTRPLDEIVSFRNAKRNQFH